MSALILACAALTACGGGNAEPVAVEVWRSLESVQCSAGGLTLAELESRLKQAGARVLSASCGDDGRMRPAACGYGDGRIGIFRVEAGAAPLPQDFRPLSELPDAKPQACN